VSGPTRSTASLTAELVQLREGLENAYRRLGVMEDRLHSLTRHKRTAPNSVEVFDVFGAAERAPHASPRRALKPGQAVWPTARAEARVLQPTPGLANLTLTGQDLAVVGFSVCGFDPIELERIVEMVAAKQAADRNFIPVFLTDVMAADIFRRRRYAFEYFPGPDARRLPGTRAWEDYARERLALIKRKYGLTRIIRFGKRGFCEA
jgi:hypothetical protein